MCNPLILKKMNSKNKIKKSVNNERRKFSIFNFQFSIAIVICLAASINIQAQVGGALNRARNAAEQTVKSAGEQAKQSAEDVKQSAGNQTSQPATNEQQSTTQSSAAQSSGSVAPSSPSSPQQTLKPSPQAIANDPRASDNTVPSAWYKRTYAERRAAYEQLPDNTYFKPYWHPDLINYYFLDEKEELNQYFIMTYLLFEARLPRFMALFNALERKEHDKNSFFNKNQTFSFYFRSFIADKIPEGNKNVHKECVIGCEGYVPFGFHSVYAYFALFATDPQGFIPFEKYCEGVFALSNLEKVIWDDDYNDPGHRENRMPLEGGGYGKLSMDDWWKAKQVLIEEGKRLYDIVLKETPLDVVQSAVSKYYNNITKFQEEKKYTQLMYNFFLFETSLYFWKYHPKSNASDETLKYLLDEYDKFLVLWDKQWRQAVATGGTPINMPQTYNMGAELENAALSRAKSQFGGEFNVDKVVFTSNQWVEFKEAKYPYRVMSRTLNAAILTKDGDKWLIRFRVFQQMSDQKGGWTQNYGFSVPMGGSSSPQPVNYK